MMMHIAGMGIYRELEVSGSEKAWLITCRSERVRASDRQKEWNLDKNPYMGFVYAAFQERATFISHGNTARLAKKSGDPVLARICGTIAADEKRHENAYVKIVEKLLEVDPTVTMVAISNMMRKDKIQDLTAEGRRAQDFLCGLPPKIRRLQKRADKIDLIAGVGLVRV
ncbi:hypothetical protein PIB30_077794 [Stylosanthes scabra]|uniref:Stearoyl-[acyl-carrier-protein] 9-desaturase n=1 Tax=Stylosanthes scabra TaxID=79078 RepID=A0ABU6UT09_9FABA|nr:hypothetical protein [Stylosanthes scabra]